MQWGLGEVDVMDVVSCLGFEEEILTSRRQVTKDKVSWKLESRLL